MKNKKLTKELVLYVIMGVLTTAVNFICYFLFEKFLSPTISTIFAWVLSVMFAYITNCKFVFESVPDCFMGYVKQISSFFLARVISGVFDIAMTFVFIEKLHFDSLIIKIIINIIVIVFNYIASKLVIFKKKK